MWWLHWEGYYFKIFLVFVMFGGGLFCFKNNFDSFILYILTFSVITFGGISLSLIFGLLVQLERESLILGRIKPFIPLFLFFIITTIFVSIFSLLTEDKDKFNLYVNMTSIFFILTVVLLGFFAIFILI